MFVLAGLGCAGLVGAGYVLYQDGIGRPPPAPKAPIVIQGGTVWDGSRRPQQGVTIVIEGDRITCADHGCGAPAGALIVDASGLAVIPGLIDLHVHMGAAAGEDDPTSPAFLLKAMRHYPDRRRAFLEHGVTTIRSVGDGLLLQNSRRAVREQQLAGPRIFTSGPVLCAPGGHPAGTIYAAYPGMISTVTRQVHTEDEARAAVLELANAGVDGIKASSESGWGRLAIPSLSPEVLAAIGDEARKHALWFAVHTGTAQDLDAAIRAGATTVEHGARTLISPETLDLMKESSVIVVPTLAVNYGVGIDPLPARTAIAQFLEAGIPLAAGSDTQGPEMRFGESSIYELELLVEKGGLTPEQALTAATVNGAKALGNPELGVLAKGAYADVVLVRGKPWENIVVLHDPVVVIANGRIAFDDR